MSEEVNKPNKEEEYKKIIMDNCEVMTSLATQVLSYVSQVKALLNKRPPI